MNWSDAEKKKSGIRKTLTVCAAFVPWMIPLCEGSLRKIFRWQSWCFGSLLESLI